MVYQTLKQDDYAKAISLPWWSVQLIAWGLFCILSFLSLTLWYGNPRWMHVVHIALQAVSGAVMTWPLSRALPFINRGGVFTRVFLHLLVIGAFAFLWNIFRMATFDYMITARDIWQDLGGWYFTALLIFGLWSALYYMMQAYSAIAFEREQAERERLRRVEAESLSREAQMKMLRYQLNPHFLFNTLNSISALVKTKRSDQARNMISQLSEFMRYTLERDKRVTISLEEELSMIRLYLDLERVRYGDRLRTDFEIDPQSLRAAVPSMILQPLFENALKYVIAGTLKGGEIKLTIGCQDKQLLIDVEDTGHPDKRNSPDFLSDIQQGVGLQNIRDRLKAHYQDAAIMSLGPSDMGGLKVSLTLPYRSHSDDG